MKRDRQVKAWMAAVLGAGVLMGAAYVAAQDAAPATRPTRARTARLVQPWSKVTDLSDEQKSQLIDIHAEIADKIKALQEEENDRCMAILSDAQKQQLQATLDKEAADRKARAAEARRAARDAAATRPDR